MKQAYFQVARGGEASTASGGLADKIRAATPGIPATQLALLGRVADGAFPANLGGEPSPVRLALLNLPDLGRVLCHTVATGDDGSSFSHLLLDVPSVVDAHQAIQSWGSSLWQNGDHSGGKDLPEALYLPVATALSDEEVSKFVAQPANAELLQYLITALLCTPSSTRVFVAAPPESMAVCVYAITRALPMALLTDFTFSTFEADPLQCSARLVGTCWPGGDGRDLPSVCYEERNVAFNTYSGRRADLGAQTPFADFAVATLATGKLAPLNELHATWQRLGVKEASNFELVYRMARGTGVLTKEESEHVLHHPTLGPWVAVRPDALKQFQEWALEDGHYAADTFSRAVVALRQKPELLAQTAEDVLERGMEALHANDINRTRNALEVLMPMLAPGKAASLWNDLLTTKKVDPAPLNWEMRRYLLPHLVRLRRLTPSEPVDAALAPWLEVPPEELATVLALDLPLGYRHIICLNALHKDGEPGPILGGCLAVHPSLVLGLAQRLTAEPGGQEKAVRLFEAVLTAGPNYHWIDDFLHAGKSLPREFLDRCILAALDAKSVQARPLVEKYGTALLELLPNHPSLERLAKDILAEPSTESLADRSVEDFLQYLPAGERMAAEVRLRRQAYLDVRAFLRQPILDGEALSKVGAALKLDPPLFPPAMRDTVLRTVAGAWYGQAGSPQVQASLETVLKSLGADWPDGPPALYRALLRHQPTQRQFWRQVDVLHALLAVSLGAAESMDLAPHMENLDAEAYGLAQQVARNGGAKALQSLDEMTANWPRMARSRWSFLLRAVQPRGAGALVRDAVLVMIGIVLGAGGLWLAQMIMRNAAEVGGP